MSRRKRQIAFNPSSPETPVERITPLYRLVQVRERSMSGPVARYELQLLVDPFDPDQPDQPDQPAEWQTIPLEIVVE